MGIIKKFIGPKSKYDQSIPYTYIAKVPIIEGDNDESMMNYYFSDTICGLVEYLDKNKIEPEEVELFGCYQQKEIPIDKKYCLSENGTWLKRPDICHSLETHYKNTMEEQFKGHVEHGVCSFEDRDREGSGPY
jgi:hypothetical protein